MGFYGVFIRKVQTNICTWNHLQDTSRTLRLHNRMRIDSFTGFILCEYVLLLFMKLINVDVNKVISKLTFQMDFPAMCGPTLISFTLSSEANVARSVEECINS